VVSLEVGSYADFLASRQGDERVADGDKGRPTEGQDDVTEEESCQDRHYFAPRSPELAAKVAEPDPDIDTSRWTEIGVHPVFAKYLVRGGFSKPTRVQTEAIRLASRGRSILVASETGSGKTLAYLLPALARAYRQSLTGRERFLETVVLVPARELALQVAEVVETLFREMQACYKLLVPVVGGLSPEKQARLIALRPPIIVGTPGRLYQLLQLQDFFADLRLVDRVILDESDKILERGHFSELVDICSLLNSREPTPLVTIASATLMLPNALQDHAVKFSGQTRARRSREASKRALRDLEKEDAVVKSGLVLDHPEVLGENAPRDAHSAEHTQIPWLNVLNDLGFSGSRLALVDLLPDAMVNTAIAQRWLRCSTELEKDEMLVYAVCRFAVPTLVFVKTASAAKRVAAALSLLGVPAWAVHASMPQRQRLRNLERLKQLSDAVIVATDLFARGLDVPKVELVIQHCSPGSVSSYIHKAGRASRREGEAVSRERGEGKRAEIGLSLSLIGPRDQDIYDMVSRVCGRQDPLPVNEEVMVRIRDLWQMAERAAAIEETLSTEQRRNSWLRGEKTKVYGPGGEVDERGPSRPLPAGGAGDTAVEPISTGSDPASADSEGSQLAGKSRTRVKQVPAAELKSLRAELRALKSSLQRALERPLVRQNVSSLIQEQRMAAGRRTAVDEKPRRLGSHALLLSAAQESEEDSLEDLLGPREIQVFNSPGSPGKRCTGVRGKARESNGGNKPVAKRGSPRKPPHKGVPPMQSFQTLLEGAKRREKET